MTTSQVIEQLRELDPTGQRLVVMSSDSEGNSYSPLRVIDTAAYLAETPVRGEIGIEELTQEYKEYGYTEEDVLEDGKPAICLWPSN